MAEAMENKSKRPSIYVIFSKTETGKINNMPNPNAYVHIMLPVS